MVRHEGNRNITEAERDRELDEYRSAHKTTASDAVVYPYLVIREMERNIREMLQRLLKKHYGSNKMAWSLGVPQGIQVEVAKYIIEYDPKRKMSEWECLDFSDYFNIVQHKENWGGLFKSYFTIEKGDSQIKDIERAAFLKKMIPIRNAVMHGRDLTEEQKEVLKSAKERFDKIYQKSKGSKATDD